MATRTASLSAGLKWPLSRPVPILIKTSRCHN
jgi:hypothetical protein